MVEPLGTHHRYLDSVNRRGSICSRHDMGSQCIRRPHKEDYGDSTLSHWVRAGEHHFPSAFPAPVEGEWLHVHITPLY